MQMGSTAEMAGNLTKEELNQRGSKVFDGKGVHVPGGATAVCGLKFDETCTCENHLHNLICYWQLMCVRVAGRNTLLLSTHVQDNPEF